MYKLSFRSSIGTGWNDNVHVSGCVCAIIRGWNGLHLKILKIISKRSNTLKSPWHVRVVTK